MQRNLKKFLAALLAFLLALALCLSACAPQVEDSQNSTGSESTQTSQQTESNQTGTSGITGSTHTESTGITETTGTTESTGTGESTGSTETSVPDNTETKETESEATQGSTQTTQPPHTHSYTEKVTAPTCKDKGYTTYTCSCGHSYKDKEVPATGNHKVSSGKCSVCGKPPVPEFNAGTSTGNPYNAGNSNYLLVYRNVTSSTEPKNYENALKSAGYTLVQANDIKSNRFVTFTKGDQMVHCSYFAADKEYRITYGPQTYMGATEPVSGYSQLVTPSVSMIEIGGTGLSMVIQLADGSFIIVDGGFGQGTYSDTTIKNADMDRMYQFLKSNTPGGGKPQITWMITHADSDHILFPSSFMKNYSSKVNVTTVCYNFPVYSSLASNMNTFKSYASQYFPNANHYIMHTGNKLYLPGCEIEFLITASEDLYPTSISNGNLTSNAWRLTIEGKTILITGDIEEALCNKMANNYGDYLASNVLQVVHHGVNGATKAFNQYVASGNKLEVCFWPIRSERKWRTQESQYRSFNQVLWNSGADHYYHDYTTTLLLPSLTKK